MKNAKNKCRSICAVRVEWFLHFILLSLLGFILSGCLTPAGKPTAEYQEKATYLYHFGQFVEWPPATFPNAKTPVVIGVLGGNPFGNDLEKIAASGNINGRRVVIRRMTPLSNLKQCQVLFVSRSVDFRLPLIFHALGDAPVLTVGESDGFLNAGGMINFITKNGAVRFEIAPAAAQRVGLKMSAQLLAMAVHLQK